MACVGIIGDCKFRKMQDVEKGLTEFCIGTRL